MSYITVDDMREQGVPDSVEDARLEDSISLAQRYIERRTGLFFEQRTKVFKLDGPGTPILELPAPALTLTEIKDLDTSLIFEAKSFVNYNREPDGEVDDFWYPRVVLRTGLTRFQRAFITPHDRTGQFRSIWPFGDQNIQVSGTFGFVVREKSASGANLITPPPIKRAMKILVVNSMDNLGGKSGLEKRRERLVKSERFGNYSYNLAEAAMVGGLIGDPEVDGILSLYTRVKAIEAG